MNQLTMRTEAGFTMGPIAIPRRRQVAQNLFRIFSVKAGMRLVTCESALEADAIYEAEGAPEVTWLCEQPLRIDRPFGKRPQYTFDLGKGKDQGDVRYYEIKPTDRLVEANDGKLKPPLWDQIEPVCRDFGFNIDFITETDLEPKQILIDNWRTLLPFAVRAYRDPDEQLATQILNLTSGSGISLRDLCLAEPDCEDNTVIAHAAMLLHKGQLSAPLTRNRLLFTTKLNGVHHESS